MLALYWRESQEPSVRPKLVVVVLLLQPLPVLLLMVMVCHLMMMMREKMVLLVAVVEWGVAIVAHADVVLGTPKSGG